MKDVVIVCAISTLLLLNSYVILFIPFHFPYVFLSYVFF